MNPVPACPSRPPRHATTARARHVARVPAYSFVVGGLVALLTGCGGPTPTTSADPTCTPPDNDIPVPATARAYAALCEEHGLGIPPTVRCEDGVRVPTTVDGVEVLESPATCDHTSMLKPSCDVGSKIQRHEGRDAQGNPLPDVTWVSFCRAAASTATSSVQLIGYRETTGATCFFEANETKDSVLPDRLGRDANNGLTGAMPAHTEAEFDRAFIPPPVQCVECHQNNAFIRNPWLEGARLPEDVDEPVVPALDAASPYYVVGGADWDMRTIHIEGNACLSCHRIGMETDRDFAANGFDSNTYMPPGSPGSLSDDYQELLDCWTNGPENTPGCDWVVPPAGDCEGGVVDDSYPHAAMGFNQGAATDDTKDDDGEAPPCPADFDPAAPCSDGDFCDQGGTIWFCSDGRWSSK